MQYDVQTPEEYMDKLEHDWRYDTLQQIREMIRTTAPGMTEGINYKMLSYGDDRGVAFHLNAQKGYVGLYVGDIRKIDRDGDLLQGLNTGKGCIRFSKTVVPAETRIGEFIERTVRLWDQGVDTEC